MDDIIIWDGNDGNTTQIYGFKCFEELISDHEIPTLSQWGIGILLLLISTIGILQIKNRFIFKKM